MINIDNMSILVVDDMKSMRLTIRKMLQNLKIGTTLRFAENGKQGLSVLQRRVFDLAIIDWRMPVMNGSQMLAHLRNDRRLRDMPVIMVTAENERDIVTEVAEIEIDAYLLKPLTLTALDKKIRTVVHSCNNPDEATRHMLNARKLEEAGNLDGSIEQVRLALRHKPSASRLLRKMGMLHFKIGKPSIGENCLRKAIEVNYQDIVSRLKLADYYMKKNLLKEAARVYLEILTLSDRHFDTAMELGEKLLSGGFLPEAMEMFSKIIFRSDKSTRIKEEIVDICLKHDEYNFPKKLMADLIRLNPRNHDMLIKSGEIHRDTGDWDKALECFRTVDSMKRGHVLAKMEIAKIYVIQGRIYQADDFLNQVLRIEPGNQDALAMRREL